MVPGHFMNGDMTCALLGPMRSVLASIVLSEQEDQIPFEWSSHVVSQGAKINFQNVAATQRHRMEAPSDRILCR